MTPTLSPEILDYIKRKRFQDISSEAPSVDAQPSQPNLVDKIVRPPVPSPAELSPMMANTGPTPDVLKPSITQPPKVSPIVQPMLDQAPDIKPEAPTMPSVVQPLAERPRDLAERPAAPYKGLPETELHKLIHQPEDVQKSDFEKPSLLRKIGGIAAGIGTGFLFKNPYAGIQMSQRILHPQYYDYLQQRAEQHEDVSKLDEIAQAQEEARQTGALNVAKIGQEQATAQWRQAQAAAQVNPIEHPQTYEQLRLKNQAAAQGTAAGTPGKIGDPYQIEFTKPDGTKGTLYANQNDKSGAWTNNGQLVDPEVIKNITKVNKTGQATNPNTPFELSLATFRAGHGGRDPQTNEEHQEVLRNAKTPEQLEGERVDTMLKRARIQKLMQDVNNDKNIDASSDELADIVKENEGFIDGLSGKALTSVALAMHRKGYAVPGKLSSAIKGQENASRTVLTQLDDIQKILERNKGRRTGVIMGRVGQLERGIGAELIPWGSEQEKADSQQLRTLIGNVIATESAMYGQGRAAVKVIDLIRDLSAKTSDSSAIMKGAFEGTRAAANARISAAQQTRYGNQKTGKEDNKPRTAVAPYRVGGRYKDSKGNSVIYLGGDPNDEKGSWRPE